MTNYLELARKVQELELIVKQTKSLFESKLESSNFLCIFCQKWYDFKRECQTIIKKRVLNEDRDFYVCSFCWKEGEVNYLKSR